MSEFTFDSTEAADRDLACRAAEIVIDTQFGSVAMLERKLRIGFGKAAGIMDHLEAHGIVGPSGGRGGRDVYFRDDQIAEALARLTDQPQGRDDDAMGQFIDHVLGRHRQ